MPQEETNWYILVANYGVFLITDFGTLLFSDYTLLNFFPQIFTDLMRTDFHRSFSTLEIADRNLKNLCESSFGGQVL